MNKVSKGIPNHHSTNLLTVAEVAQYIKIKEGTLRNWVYKGQIPFLKVNGALRFRIQDIEKWMDENKNEVELY